MAHLSMGPRVRLPLYAIASHGAALPPGESILATYANKAAFDAAVVPTAAGEQCQLAGWPTTGVVTRLVADWDNVSAFKWGVA